MIAAVFDLDRTLLPGTTAERLFLRDLVRQRVLGPSAALRTAAFAVRVGLRHAGQRIRAERPYLKGLHDASLRLHGYRCARDSILPVLSDRGLECLEEHHNLGHHVVLLSGSLPYVVEPLARYFSIDHVICSRLETCQQRVTGRLCGLHPYGEAKATLIQEYARQQSLDLSISYCYADHHTDVPMLRVFGNPVCVNPSEKLRHVASECDWKIATFS